VLAGLILPAVPTRADVVYVWGSGGGSLPDGGTLQEISTNGVASVMTTYLSGINGPIGLVCDNVGNLYAGDPSTSTIWRVSPDGIPLRVGDVDSVSGLAFDSTGILYVTIPNFAELDLPDYHSGRYDRPYNGTNVGGYAVTIALDVSKNVYVANNTNAFPYPVNPSFYSAHNNTVEKFVYGTSWTNLGIFASGLNSPWGMAFGNDGSLYVANSGTNGDLSNTILKFSTNGTRSIFATATNGLSAPRGLAFDSAGNLYVANSLTGTILKFAPDGTGSVFAAGLTSPTSIAIYPGLNVWSAKPITLSKPTVLTNGAFQFSFSENIGLSFTVLAGTNASSSTNAWSLVGAATEAPPGQYQFTDTQATNYLQRLYRVRSP
jgi:sugar lactone lactonase YvrE